jgi:hypothetical protein
MKTDEEFKQELQTISEAAAESVRDEKAEIEAAKKRYSVYRRELLSRLTAIEAEMKAAPEKNTFLESLLASVREDVGSAFLQAMAPRRSSCVHLSSHMKWTGKGVEFIRVCDFCDEQVPEKK